MCGQHMRSWGGTCVCVGVWGIIPFFLGGGRVVKGEGCSLVPSRGYPSMPRCARAATASPNSGTPASVRVGGWVVEQRGRDAGRKRDELGRLIVGWIVTGQPAVDQHRVSRHHRGRAPRRRQVCDWPLCRCTHTPLPFFVFFTLALCDSRPPSCCSLTVTHTFPPPLFLRFPSPLSQPAAARFRVCGGAPGATECPSMARRWLWPPRRVRESSRARTRFRWWFRLTPSGRREVRHHTCSLALPGDWTLPWLLPCRSLFCLVFFFPSLSRHTCHPPPLSLFTL